MVGSGVARDGDLRLIRPRRNPEVKRKTERLTAMNRDAHAVRERIIGLFCDLDRLPFSNLGSEAAGAIPQRD